MSAIFMSYRRADAQGWAGRLSANLAQAFGEVARFFDISSIPPGADFLIAIEEAIKRCSAAFVMIGPEWLKAVNEAGSRRIDDPNDVVRLEVAAALKQGVPVVPVLVGGAKMPREAELPEPLRALARRNAFELSDSRWDYDCDRLFESIAQQTGLTRLDSKRSDPGAVKVADALEATDSEFGDVVGLRGARAVGTSVEVLRGAKLKRVKMGDIVGAEMGPDKSKHD